jgi:hypothetical protein
MFHKGWILKHKMKHDVKNFSDGWILSGLQNPVFKGDFDLTQIGCGRVCPWHADCNIERASFT